MRVTYAAGLLGLALCTVDGRGCRIEGESTSIGRAGERRGPQHGDFGAQRIQIGGQTRTYRLVVPRTVDLTRPVSLVVAFHGMLVDSKDVMPMYTRLSETAEEKKFIIVYPEAVGKSWGVAPDKVNNDLAFFDALLARVQSEYRIDPDRVFVLGMSNGGYFAHLVGRERSKTVAAVASHSGPLGLQTLLGVRADRKFPVLIIHGDRDPIFPVSFARENRDKYEREGHEVDYVELPGHGHMWATEADINERVWEFFSEHPRGRK